MRSTVEETKSKRLPFELVGNLQIAVNQFPDAEKLEFIWSNLGFYCIAHRSHPRPIKLSRCSTLKNLGQCR